MSGPAWRGNAGSDIGGGIVRCSSGSAVVHPATSAAGEESEVLLFRLRLRAVAEEDRDTHGESDGGQGAREVFDDFHDQPRDARLRSSAARLGCMLW